LAFSQSLSMASMEVPQKKVDFNVARSSTENSCASSFAGVGAGTADWSMTTLLQANAKHPKSGGHSKLSPPGQGVAPTGTPFSFHRLSKSSQFAPQ
jgi:hypothetical protein